MSSKLTDCDFLCASVHSIKCGQSVDCYLNWKNLQRFRKKTRYIVNAIKGEISA